MNTDVDRHAQDEEFARFWTQRHLCVLATSRPDGSVHLTPVGATYEPETRTARVITSSTSVKTRNITAAGASARAALTQVDGRRWTTLEGTATVTADPASVAEAERRYAERYRPPRANPRRVVIEIAVDRVMGTVQPPAAIQSLRP
ncbi:TIGR03618 family F420-dependent PPOX class oxidoreductase [Streptacidiphilus neutrinimicus]|uniref:TIGR03618 family F420-dependent PPOX class oxidoreductase n=1 Tax=Streptacidiphilus neutrinimicus TaxID=105420 RepID=UPI0005A5E646|nr:TIGR03618 family F420-dependent PPOX class oxidoreductase [Streptacidiphilus neutrinimicus]